MYTIMQLIEKGVLAIDEGTLQYEPDLRYLMLADGYLHARMTDEDGDFVLEGSVVVAEDGVSVDYYATPCGFERLTEKQTNVNEAVFVVSVPAELEV